MFVFVFVCFVSVWFRWGVLCVDFCVFYLFVVFICLLLFWVFCGGGGSFPRKISDTPQTATRGRGH